MKKRQRIKIIKNYINNCDLWVNPITSAKICTANFTISQYQKKIDDNDPEYLAWKNFLETGTWKNYE